MLKNMQPAVIIGPYMCDDSH